MPFEPSKLNDFPTLPGVYIMKKKGGAVLYIGKAKNLRVRVKQYFAAGRDSRPMVPYLVSHIDEIETILVSSEKEALLLENNLIKRHKPKYNVFLKDDKTYTALKINSRHPWPMVDLVRYRGKPKADGLYFGPYTSAFAARQTLDLIQKIFPMRQCSDQELLRRSRPCILYDMKRCIAPCVGLCTKEEYSALVQRTIRFLRGQDKEVIDDLYEEMNHASERLEFERAGTILQTIRQLEKTLQQQNVDKPLGRDADAIGIYRQGDEVAITQVFIRNGRVEGTHHRCFSKVIEEDAEILENFIVQNYQEQVLVPHEILLPISLEGAQALTEIISTNKQRTVQILAPQRGDKKALVDMAHLNAENAFKKEKDAAVIRERILLEMQEKFHLLRYPKRIECFDNSNLSGDEPVSALIAFTDGQKDKQRYRKFKLRTVDPSDDYGAMQEVLTRRYKKAEEDRDLPDLLIVDGGKGHLNIALKVLQELNIVSVDVISIAKEEGRHDRGVTSEQIFLPNIKDPIFLPKHSPILFMLQQIRDEAHRFAITFQRHRRSKKTIRSALGDIPGIGPVKQKLLLKHFGSLKRIGDATDVALKEVKGINQANIVQIRAFFEKKSE